MLIMPTFMVLRDLVRGKKGRRISIPRGSRTNLEWLDEPTQQLLVRKGAVREVASPPLRELAGWKTRGRRLLSIGIETMEDMLDADPEEISGELGVRPSTVEKWQDELRSWNAQEESLRRSR